MVKSKRPLQDKMYFSNNSRKMAGLPMWRKKNKRKRKYTRCEAAETTSELIDYFHR